jgi:hypothetical protein
MTAANGRGPNATTEAILKDLEGSLAVIGTARYSRNGQTDGSALNTAFENGVSAIRKLRAANRWPMRSVRSLTNQVMDIGWSR